jgi:chromosome condensin MukBEF MukE localization factor
MNLTKALKAKKKLIKQIDTIYNRFQKFNSYEAGTTPTYSAEEAYNEWLLLTSELVELKAKIQRANAPIIDKIFRLGELKSIISRLRGVNTTAGIHRERSYGLTESVVEHIAFMDLKKRDADIEVFENEIEKLQEEIEAFNIITKI